VFNLIGMVIYIISKLKKIFVFKKDKRYKVFINSDGKIIYEDKNYIGIVTGLINHKEMFPGEKMNYYDKDFQTAHILYQSNYITVKNSNNGTETN